jgi:acyl-CoA synthetase (AMP-forming)/AMP-acid ligase II
MRDFPTPADDLATILSRAKEFSSSAKVSFVDRHEREIALNFGELERRARCAAAHLARVGVKRGERVAIILPTSPSFFDAFFGCQILGAVATPLYPPVRLGRLDEYFDRTTEQIRRVDAVAIVTDRQARRILGELVARTRPRLGTILAEDFAQTSVPTQEFEAPEPNDLALVQFSSGTTRTPAPVGLTHRQILANVDAILDALPDSVFTEGQTGVSWLPLYHDMGLIGCLMSAARAARPLVLIPPELFLAKPALWLRALARHRATISTAPDFGYALCLTKVRDEELEGVRLDSWRVAMNGAEPVAPKTMRAFQERFARFGLKPDVMTPVYGLSEATLAVTFSDPNRPFRSRVFDRNAMTEGTARPTADSSHGIELASVGRPLRGYQVRICDSMRNDARAGSVGRVLVRGPSVIREYLDGSTNANGSTNDSWFDTGDLGFWHDDELYICGRAKDIVIVRGRNHAPHDIERACDAAPEVRTGCSVAVSDIGADGEQLLVFVELKPEVDLEGRVDIERRCRQSILEITGLSPHRIVFLRGGTIPRTSSGKLRRRETLRLWARGELKEARAVTPVLLASALVRSAIGYLRAR